MAIIQTVDFYLFHEAFKQVRPDNFSYYGLELLFEYLDNLSDDIGENIELDVIALCCDYSEYNLSDWFYEFLDPALLSGDEDEAQEIMLAEITGNTPDNIIAHNDDYSVIIVDSNA